MRFRHLSPCDRRAWGGKAGTRVKLSWGVVLGALGLVMILSGSIDAIKYRGADQAGTALAKAEVGNHKPRVNKDAPMNVTVATYNLPTNSIYVQGAENGVLGLYQVD